MAMIPMEHVGGIKTGTISSITSDQYGRINLGLSATQVKLIAIQMNAAAYSAKPIIRQGGIWGAEVTTYSSSKEYPVLIPNTTFTDVTYYYIE